MAYDRVDSVADNDLWFSILAASPLQVFFLDLKVAR